jgi:mono/diheme cytochrome c family protein
VVTIGNLVHPFTNKKLAFMKKSLIVVTVIFSSVLLACSGGSDKKTEVNTPSSTTESPSTSSENPAYDPQRGEGKFKDVQVAATLDPAMAAAGEKVYTVNCSGCHKLTDERLVGPGFTGVTGRHTADWIMNFVTNTDVMINKDPKAQALLEICLVRMPNQNLSDDDARHVYEYLRKNDGVK